MTQSQKSAHSGEIVSEISRHRRIDRVERRRTCGRAARRATFSCRTVKPVTYDVPAHAPTTRRSSSAARRERRSDAASDEDDAGRRSPRSEHRLARQPLLEPQQRDDADRGAEAERGHQHTERRAAAAEHLLGEHGPSGIIAPPPMRPTPRPSITPRTSAVVTDEREALLDLAERLGPVDALAARGASSRGIGSRQTITADTRNVHASNTSASDLLVDLERREGVEAAEPRRHAGEQREDDRRDRERAVATRRARASSPTRAAPRRRGSAPTRPSPVPRAA